MKIYFKIKNKIYYLDIKKTIKTLLTIALVIFMIKTLSINISKYGLIGAFSTIYRK